ncbi:MAG TPA: hypothetical protein VGL98_06140 [Gammaproteobacteria bacterium]
MAVRADSPTSIELAVSDVWVIDVCVTDADGDAADDAPVVTVTLPAGGTATPTVESLSAGRYRAEYIVVTTGRYVARAVTLTHGAADFAAYVTGTTAATGMPDLDDVLNYLGWTEDNDNDDAATALATESAAQRRVCRIGATYPDDLRGALYRRVARNLALKGLPLAVLRGDAESGDTVLPGRDPEVRRLEGPHRKLVAG